MCFKCGQLGHIAKDCTTNMQGAREDKGKSKGKNSKGKPTKGNFGNFGNGGAPASGGCPRMQGRELRGERCVGRRPCLLPAPPPAV